MKAVDWTDHRGRNYRSLLPDEVPEAQAELGILLGPPDIVDAVGMPEPLATRLHNLLHRRGLYNIRAARKNPQALLGALQAALKVDMNILMQAFQESERETPVPEDGRA